MGPDALRRAGDPAHGRHRDRLRRGRLPELRDLLPHAHAHLLGDRVPVREPGDAGGGFSPIGGIDRYTPGFVGDVVNDRQRLYYVSLGVAIVVYALIRYLVRTPFGIALEGIRDEPLRMASLGYNVPLHRTLAFGIGSLIAAGAGVLFAWWSGQLSPSDIGLQATIQLLVIAVIGGLTRIEGAWVGAFAYIWISNEVTNRIPEGGLWLIGGSFNTVIGLAFLAIVIASRRTG